MEEQKNTKSIGVIKSKKKKKKTAIIYGGKFYVPVDRGKYSVKNTLYLGDYDEQCKEYLKNVYGSLSEKLVSMMLENHVFVLMPEWSTYVDDMMKIINKQLFDKMILKTSEYSSHTFLRNLRYPKYASQYASMNAMIKDMDDRMRMSAEDSTKFSEKLYRSIKFIHECEYSIIKNTSRSLKFYEALSIYNASVAEFVEFTQPKNYPCVALLNHTILNINETKNKKHGFLFKMSNVKYGKTIFIERSESIYYTNWKEFIAAIDLGRVGKVVGETVYIPPHERICFMLDPTLFPDSVLFS